jgi:hypothetical protein
MQRSTCFLLAYLVVVSGRTLKVAGAPENSVVLNSSCQLTVVGITGSPDALRHVSVHCTEAQGLQFLVDPIVQPFLSFFSGVYIRACHPYAS